MPGDCLLTPDVQLREKNYRIACFHFIRVGSFSKENVLEIGMSDVVVYERQQLKYFLMASFHFPFVSTTSMHRPASEILQAQFQTSVIK